MNLADYRKSLVIKKFWGRNYFGKSAMPILEKAREKTLPKTPMLESVSRSAVIDWYGQVLLQVDDLIDNVFGHDDEDVENLLSDLKLDLEAQKPDGDDTAEDLKSKMDMLYRSIHEYENKVEGSLKQYIAKLSNTVKTISLDTIEDEAAAPEEGGEEAGAGGGAGISTIPAEGEEAGAGGEAAPEMPSGEDIEKELAGA